MNTAVGGQPEQDGQGNSEGRSAGYADQTRIGERIAEHALQRRARDAESRADQGGENQTRQADRPDHGLLGRAVLDADVDADLAEQDGDDAVDSDLECAQSEIGDHDDRE